MRFDDPFTEQDHALMRQALAQAEVAMQAGEVPVGAVLVCAGEVLGSGQNRVIRDADPSAHAEIVAMRAAGRKLGNYRLPDCDLYVTLEPCCMCAGAMIHARIRRLVYAAPDPKTGAAGGRFALLCDPRHNHRMRIQDGLCAPASSELLRGFFLVRRNSGSGRL